jgi:hypothetical protein
VIVWQPACWQTCSFLRAFVGGGGGVGVVVCGVTGCFDSVIFLL